MSTDMLIESPVLKDTHSMIDTEEEEKENKNMDSASNNIRKNLTSAFEKQKHVKDDNNSTSSAQAPKNNTRKRPPLPTTTTGRTTKTTTMKKTMTSSSECNNKLLSVYLRLRPLDKSSSSSSSSSSSKSSKTSSKDNVNTIEVIHNKDNDNNAVSTTTVRSYPPSQSNAAKSARGGIRSNSSNKQSKKRVYNNSGYSSNDDDNNSIDSSASTSSLTLGVKEHTFNQVFASHSTQKEVFDNVAAPLVEGLFSNNIETSKRNESLSGSPMKKKIRLQINNNVKEEGKSALLFAYGCTNAGKTHTMIGNKFNFNEATKELNEQSGILPRTLERIFKKTQEEEKSSSKFILQMSSIEIYNEQIFDLLSTYDDGNGSCSTSTRYNLRKRGNGNIALKLREDTNGRTVVHGLTKHNIQSVSKGLEIAEHAMSKRHSATNNLNSKSSRSHFICQLELACYSSSPEMMDVSLEQQQHASKYLWLVDLAGSERSAKTGIGHKSINAREANHINSSLMTLMRCMQVLSDNQINSNNSSSSSSKSNNKLGVVPYRDSKLTHFLIDHLSGSSNSSTRMIVNVNPSAACYDETQHVLSYASVARTIKINADAYNAKRKAIAGTQPQKKDRMPSSECEDLTSKTDKPQVQKKVRTTHPAKTKLAGLIQKLSPKRATKGTLAKKKAELRSMRGATTTSKALVLNEDDNAIAEWKGEVAKLKAEKEILIKMNEQLLLKSKELEMDSVVKEAEIRKEVVEEMEEVMAGIEERCEEKLRARSMPTPQSVARQKRAEVHVESLIDKVDECEEEMKRMKDRHDEEVDEILEDLDNKTSDWEEQKSRYESTIKQLEEQLEKTNEA